MVLMDKADVEALLTTIKVQSAQSLVAVAQPTLDDGQYHSSSKGAWKAAAVVTPASNDTASGASTTSDDVSSSDSAAADSSASSTTSEQRRLFRNSKGESSTRQAELSRGASKKASSSSAASQGQVSSSSSFLALSDIADLLLSLDSQKTRRSVRIFVSGAQPKRRSLIVTGSNGAMISLVGGDMASIEADIAGHHGSTIRLDARRHNGRNDKHRQGHEHVHSHRRRQEKVLTGLVGQLGVLQPLSGAMEGTGLSQLVANLIITPLQALGEATSFAAAGNATSSDSVNATAFECASCSRGEL